VGGSKGLTTYRLGRIELRGTVSALPVRFSQSHRDTGYHRPMTTWLARAGRTGDREDLALEKGIAVLGWDEIPDLAGANSREDVEVLYRDHSPDAGAGRVGNHVGQLWAFSHRIQIGDLVILPLTRRSVLISYLSVDRIIRPFPRPEESPRQGQTPSPRSLDSGRRDRCTRVLFPGRAGSGKRVGRRRDAETATAT
jgi:hypothetical protein